MRAIWHWLHTFFPGWAAQGNPLGYGAEISAYAWRCETCGHTWIEVEKF